MARKRASLLLSAASIVSCSIERFLCLHGGGLGPRSLLLRTPGLSPRQVRRVAGFDGGGLRPRLSSESRLAQHRGDRAGQSEEQNPHNFHPAGEVRSRSAG